MDVLLFLLGLFLLFGLPVLIMIVACVLWGWGGFWFSLLLLIYINTRGS